MADEEIIKFDAIHFAVDPADAGGRAYKGPAWYEEFRNPFYAEIQTILRPSWVIDIGSNYGLTVLFSRQRFPQARIVAAEPYDVLAGYIRRNAALNGVGNFELFEGIVGDSDEETEFHVHKTSTQDSRVKAPGAAWTPVRARQTTLDRLTDRIAKDEPVYIKIDTQGYERRVFGGGEAFLSRNSRWVLKSEFAPHWLRSQGTDPGELLRYLLGRYAVFEMPARFCHDQASLWHSTRSALNLTGIPRFIEHVENLNRDRKGWVDILVLPHQLVAEVRQGWATGPLSRLRALCAKR